MKKITLFCLLTFSLTGSALMAQSHDTTSARQVIEKGTKGDIILGNENKKKQLHASPQILQPADSTMKKETFVQSKKKKSRHRQCCKTK